MLFALEACFEAGKIASNDVHNSDNVVFWATNMHQHLTTARNTFSGKPEDFVTSLDPWAGLFLKFVGHRLLQVKNLDDAQAVGRVLAKVEKDFPDVLEGLGKVVMTLLSTDCKDIAEASTSLSLSHRAELFRSPLWAAYCAKQHDQQLHEIVKKVAEGKDVQSEIDSLLNNLGDGSPLKEAVMFGQVFFRLKDDKSKAKFVCEKWGSSFSKC